MSIQKESSFEIAPFQPEARSAHELWHQLQPAETDGSHEHTTISNCQLGHFRVEEQIGRGGMGAVYRAVDTRLDRVVALKVLSPAQSNDFGSVERFRNEARAAARMDHDNIARVYYVGEDQGLWFIAFEFVHGGNVKELIERRGAINPADAVNYTLQIAQALRHTDAAGVVHRDIKPSNIIITPAGRAKLVDLGLARKRGPEASHDLTVDGTTLGTFDYISPEQAKDPKKVDVRSDIYSLGCTLYHMLTGEPPYPKGTMLQKLLDHQAKGIPDAAEKNPRIPQELSAVVRKMMASEPSDRYASPEELIDDLRLIAQLFGLKPAAIDEEQWVRPRRTDGWELWKQYGGWLIAAALLLAAVFVIDYAQRIPTNEPRPEELDFASTEPPGTVTQDAFNASESFESADAPPPSRPLGSSAEQGSRPHAENLVAGTDDPHGNTEVVEAESQRLLRSGEPLRPTNLGSEGPPLFTGPELGPQDDIPPPITSLATQPIEELLEDSDRGQGREETASPASRPEVSGDEGINTFPLDQGPRTNPSEPFTVMVNGVRRKSYATLDSACSEAPDGASIELAFDGDQVDVQHPLRIFDKHLRILPAQGRRPKLRFTAPADGQLGRHSDVVKMIEVSQGSLEVYNLDLQFEVSRDLNVRQWSLIALHDADELSLRGVSITAVTAETESVAIVEITEPVGVPFDEGSPSPVQINAEDCFIRGHGDFLLVQNIDSSVVWLNNVAVALDGTLVCLKGTDQRQVTADMGEINVVQLELKNVTSWLKNGLASFDVQPNFSVPHLHVDAEDSVIAIGSAHPLVKMQGHLDLFDFEDLLEWSDRGTFLQSIELAWEDPFWQILSSDRTRNLNRDEFDSRWSRQRSIKQTASGKFLTIESDLPLDQVLPEDLELLRVSENPAIGGAVDGADAGVDMETSRFRQMQVSNLRDGFSPESP